MVYNVVFLDRGTVPDHISLPEPGFECHWVDHQQTDSGDTVERLRHADIVVTNKVLLRESELGQLPNLKHIALFAAGYDNIDIQYCRDHGISVSNTRGYATTSLPEHALSMMFALRRQLFAYHGLNSARSWSRSPFFHDYFAQTLDLAGSRLGIVGSGSLGQAMADLATAIGMQVHFADRKGQAASGKNQYLPFSELIRESDIVSLHCPLTEQTKHLIGLDELRQMKSHALLINCSRGGLVNESDLVIALQQNLIAGAGFDVATQEPILENNPLLELVDLPNFILTPHVAWMSDGAMTIQAQQVIDNLQAYVAGECQHFVV